MGLILFTYRCAEDDDSSLFKTFNYCSSFNFKWYRFCVLAYAIGIKGTPLSAGFGYTGLVGPINAFNRMSETLL